MEAELTGDNITKMILANGNAEQFEAKVKRELKRNTAESFHLLVRLYLLLKLLLTGWPYFTLVKEVVNLVSNSLMIVIRRLIVCRRTL